MDSVLRSVEGEERGEFIGGHFYKSNSIKDLYHNDLNNLEATFVKLSEKIHDFNTEFIDVWQQFTESYYFVTVTVKISNKFWGMVDDLSFFECLCPFCFLSI